MRFDSVFTGIPRPDSPDFRELVAFCESNRGQILAALPWVAGELAEAVGFAAMLELVRRRSGRVVYVPSDPAQFARTLGLPLSDRAHDRLRRWATERNTVELPSAWGVFLALRRVAVEQAVSTGSPDQEVSARFGATTRYLRKLRQRQRTREA